MNERLIASYETVEAVDATIAELQALGIDRSEVAVQQEHDKSEAHAQFELVRHGTDEDLGGARQIAAGLMAAVPFGAAGALVGAFIAIFVHIDPLPRWGQFLLAAACIAAPAATVGFVYAGSSSGGAEEALTGAALHVVTVGLDVHSPEELLRVEGSLRKRSLGPVVRAAHPERTDCTNTGRPEWDG